MKGKCIVSSCGKAASKCCGSCGWVRYCSTDCQKRDWKEHHKKDECINMNKLSSVTLTEVEIIDVADRVSNISVRLLANGEDARSIDLLRKGIDFARDHLGRLDRRHTVKADSITISDLLVKLGRIYYFNMQGSSENDNHAISCFSEARELLVMRRDAGMDDEALWDLLFCCDKYLYLLYFRTRISHSEKAKYHAAQYVAAARQYKGPDQVDHLITALPLFSTSLVYEGNYSEGLALAEEAYLIASKHYSPAHKLVLRACNQMIVCLLYTKDFSTADTYCRMNYANVIDPMNAGEYDVEDEMDIMNQLAKIFVMKEPDDDEIVEKALADEAIDVSRKAWELSKKCTDKRCMLDNLGLLLKTSIKGNRLTEETEGILHQYVTACIAENHSGGNHALEPFQDLCYFYIRLLKTLQMSKKKSILVQENIELCSKRLFELKHCINYTKGSQKIKPFFKNNMELYI